jgi:hypothetical protein
MRQQDIVLSDDEYMMGFEVSTDEWNHRYRPWLGSENHSPARQGNQGPDANGLTQSLEANCEDDGDKPLRESEL